MCCWKLRMLNCCCVLLSLRVASSGVVLESFCPAGFGEPRCRRHLRLCNTARESGKRKSSDTVTARTTYLQKQEKWDLHGAAYWCFWSCGDLLMFLWKKEVSSCWNLPAPLCRAGAAGMSRRGCARWRRARCIRSQKPPQNLYSFPFRLDLEVKEWMVVPSGKGEGISNVWSFLRLWESSSFALQRGASGTGILCVGPGALASLGFPFAATTSVCQ